LKEKLLKARTALKLKAEGGPAFVPLGGYRYRVDPFRLHELLEDIFDNEDVALVVIDHDEADVVQVFAISTLDVGLL
jgi:hypothetical protein